MYTENPKQPWAQAVAILGTKIVAVGDDTAIEKMRGMGTKVLNAGGKLVLPGFTDCHIHFLDGSLSERIFFQGFTSKWKDILTPTASNISTQLGRDAKKASVLY